MPTIDKTVAGRYQALGTRRDVVGKYTGPSSYVTGGDSFTAADVELGVLEFITITPPIESTPVCVIAVYDYTNSKVLFFDMAGAQVANGTDLSAYTARFKAEGY